MRSPFHISTTIGRLNIPSAGLRSVLLTLFVLLLGYAPCALRADDAGTTTAATTVETEGAADKSLENRDKQEKAAIGMMVLVGIALAGVGLVLVIILWGNRLRRVSRRPLPSADRGDELYYLKPPKDASSVASDDDFELDTRAEQS